MLSSLNLSVLLSFVSFVVVVVVGLLFFLLFCCFVMFCFSIRVVMTHFSYDRFQYEMN